MPIHNKTTGHICILEFQVIHTPCLFRLRVFCGCYTYFMIFFPSLSFSHSSPPPALHPPDTKAATSPGSPGSGVLINKSRQRRLKAQKCSRLSDPGSAPLLFLRALPAALSSFWHQRLRPDISLHPRAAAGRRLKPLPVRACRRGFTPAVLRFSL